ncbi:MAG: molecular chaperone DnaJ [Rhodobacterales bacterium]|nr:molecular chaperone DnaJ [Rhodobacterales bacterium]
MARRDFYNILGVERTATTDEIKRAYRALARRWHPDHNKAADAEVRFKDITEAYRTLNDVDRRARYDRMGPLYTEDGRPPRPEDVQKAVGAMFGNLFRRKGKERGEDLRYTVSLTLEEVATGAEKEVIVPRMVRCGTCQGDGAEPTNGRQTCTVCSGSGKATGPRLFRSECYHCQGRGFSITIPCHSCKGQGRNHLDDTLKVKIPTGVATGQKLKLSGKGNAPRGQGKPGDLLVIINVTDHDLFRRRGEDLQMNLPLTYDEMVLGAEVTVPTLEGTTTIRIPQGSAPGKVLRLAGRGLPRVGRKQRGDLHLQIVLDMPKDLTQPQQRALRSWSKHLPASAHPRRAEFDQALQDRK